MQHSNPSRSGIGTTVGATSLELITLPVPASTAGIIINASCLGIDRANTTQTVTFSQGGGGGINLGALSLLPNLFGGTQKSLSLITASVTITLASGFMVLTVTGVAGKTIDWVGRIDLLALEQ